MRQNARIAVLSVALLAAGFGLYQFKTNLDVRAEAQARLTIKVAHFGIGIQTRIKVYLDEHGYGPTRDWNTTPMGWFDRRVPMTLTLNKDGQQTRYHFLITPEAKRFEGADDAAQRLLQKIRTWARAKTPVHLRNRIAQ